jgi:ADP-Ribosyltransferase in polyvalent proteins
MEHPKILHNGQLVHTTNSEGQRIHPTDEGIKNFHDWFSGSKVVDKHGRPQVVYHGSINKNIESFDPQIAAVRPRSGPNGTYFTSNQMSAFNYTKPPIGNPNYKTQRGSITSAYISANHPLDVTKDIKKYQKGGLTFSDAKKKSIEKLDTTHDSVIFGGDGMNHDEYIVFDPKNVKSATGNTGAFSHSPKINESFTEYRLRMRLERD